MDQMSNLRDDGAGSSAQGKLGAGVQNPRIRFHVIGGRIQTLDPARARNAARLAPCVKSWGVLQDLRIAKACELVGLVQTSRFYAQHIRNSGDNRTGGDRKWQPC